VTHDAAPIVRADTRVQRVSPEVRGYVFWGAIAAVIAGTELLGVGWVQRQLHWRASWPTISTTVGHLGEQWTIVYFAVVGLIAAVTFHGFVHGENQTTLGRAKTCPRAKDPTALPVSWESSVLLMIGAVFLALKFADDKYWRGYLIYGSFLVFGVLLPSFLILTVNREAQFPTFFSTFRSVGKHRRLWSWIGPILIGLLAALVFHLALYPWPNIANEPSTYAGLKAAGAKSKAERALRLAGAGSKLSYSGQIRGIDDNLPAWLVYFSPTKNSGLDSGCLVVVTAKEEARPKPPCPTVPR
jgi:hypothetical protein